MADTHHNVGTLKDLIDERDRRYTDNRKCDQDAVKLAKEAADEAKGKVSTATILAVIGCLLSTAALVVGIVEKFAGK